MQVKAGCCLVIVQAIDPKIVSKCLDGASI